MLTGSHYLLSHGVDLSLGNNLGYTPLILASVSNHASLVQRYVDRGDDLNARDIDGETALSLAIENDWPRVIHILQTANAETKDYGELSVPEAMLRASREGALGTILSLRDRGASINGTDEQGNTPLMLAAGAGFVGVVRSLYHLGADINHKNLASKSASNLAKEADQQKVLKTLIEFGADDALLDVYGINPHDADDGSRKTIDMADMLMGRYSHPFKHKLPYHQPEDPADDTTDEDEDSGESLLGRDEDIQPQRSNEVSSMLDQLEKLINTPHIRGNLPEGHYEGITARINFIRRQGEESIPTTQLDDLFEVTEFLANQPGTEEPPPPLFEAATEGDLQSFRRLIKAGADVKEALPDGTTLLMTAAEHGHHDILQELIKLGVDVNQRKPDTFSALLIACFLDHDDIVKTLAKHGADVNAAYEIDSSQGSSGNQTALTIAAARGNCPMCALLLKLGADLNVVSDSGYTPLMWSLANGSSEDAAEFLLKAGANPDPDAATRLAISTTTTPLILASTNGMTAIVKALLKRNVAVDKADGDGCTALKRASSEGHEETVALLLKAGASPNIADHEGWTALINAAGKGHVDVCKSLLKAGADVNAIGAQGQTPLRQAIGARSDIKALDALKEMERMASGGDDDEYGDHGSSLDLIKALLKAGANPNALHNGVSPLSEAIEHGDEELAKLLKKYGATREDSQPIHDTSADDVPESEEGKAFLAAAMHADWKGLRELVLNGVDVNYADQDGRTALGFLLVGMQDDSNGRIFHRNANQCLDYLMCQGANPNIGDPPPFILAAMERRLHLVQAMLAAGADINRSIGDGQTALFMSLLAPDAGQPADDRCALALMKAGADSSLRHESGAMPIHLAAGSNYLGALSELLRRRPEDLNATTNIGITPLMMAATEGHAEAVRLLTRSGADLTLKSEAGLTARDVAVKNGNDDLIPLLC